MSSSSCGTGTGGPLDVLRSRRCVLLRGGVDGAGRPRLNSPRLVGEIGSSLVDERSGGGAWRRLEGRTSTDEADETSLGGGWNAGRALALAVVLVGDGDGSSRSSTETEGTGLRREVGEGGLSLGPTLVMRAGMAVADARRGEGGLCGTVRRASGECCCLFDGMALVWVWARASASRVALG